MKLTKPQLRVLQRIANGEECYHRTGIVMTPGWKFAGEQLLLNKTTVRTLVVSGLLAKNWEGSGFKRKGRLQITDAGRQLLAEKAG
jgi:hypothetical protein